MKLLRHLSCMMLFFTIISCGGSGGSLSRDDTPDSGGGSTSNITLTLAISDTTVSNLNPAVVTATLKDGNSPLAQKVISFTTELGQLIPSSGTALTDANGVAVIELTAGDVRGASNITATYRDVTNDREVTTELGFTTQGDDINVGGDINIVLQLVNANGDATDTITSTKPGKVIATVNGITAPVLVTFTSSIGHIPISTALTDKDNNQASVDILAGSDLGAGTITATIESGETGNAFVIIGSTTVSMGSGTPFVKGVAEISLSPISAGGTAVISVDIVDEDGALFTEAINVNFTSSCATTKTAIISSPISTSNGKASSTYLAQGCVGNDVITVSANAGGINLSATGTINVHPANVGSIAFISALPENISLLGTGALGGSESSVIKFKVLDTNGNPVNNRSVDFSLNTDVGGITLNPASATTNAEGIVQTVINWGTVATSVRVQATISGSSPEISSQSSVLVVSTGIPDQDSFSLAADILNVEGWSIDGEEREL